MLSIPYFTCGYASAYPAYPAAPPMTDTRTYGKLYIDNTNFDVLILTNHSMSRICTVVHYTVLEAIS